MTDIFLRIVELSWQAGVLALAVMLARLALRRAPKWAVCLLWALVAVRLVLPFSLQSPVSLQAAQSPVTAVLYELPQTQEAAQKTDEVLSGGSAEPLMPLPPTEVVTAQPVPTPKPVMTVSLLAAIWLAGVVMMLTYMLVSYLGIYRRVCTAVRLEDNVYRCGSWGTPFVLGLLRPRIYVPEGMDDTALPQVLAHERCHIRRGDHLVKPLAFLLLALHWFNPVLWAAYVLLGRDMENACDERVLRGVDGAGRAAYSRALVACAVRQRPAAVCPLAFGEVAVQERVKNAMNGKKPAVWAAVLLAIAAAVIAVCFLTSPGRREPSAGGAWDAETLYALRTPYVGDPSAVGRILNALGLPELGGEYLLEKPVEYKYFFQLETAQEPYGVKVFHVFEENINSWDNERNLEMWLRGYLALALIDNAEWVEWQPWTPDMPEPTTEGVFEFPIMYADTYREDITAARQSVEGLRALIDKLEQEKEDGALQCSGRPVMPGVDTNPCYWDADEADIAWSVTGDNDPVSIDPADYGIVYDAAHLPDWETCPLSYLCAYLLGSDGAYTEGAADTLAARYRQAPRTVQGYLDKLAAKYEGVDQRLMAAIRTADGETFRIEPTVDVRKSAAAALDDRLTETLAGYFLMRANAIANNATGTAYCVEKLRWDALSRAQAAVWPYVAADDLRAAHITVDVTEVRTLNDGGTRLVLEELTMLDYGTGSDRYGWGTTHRLEIHDDRADVPRVTWDAYEESDLGDGHVSQDQQTDISAAAMDMAITGPWTGLVTDTRTEQAGGTEYHLIRIAGRWFGGTVQELGTPAQVGDLVSVWNYAAAGGDFEPLWQQELLERGSGGKTTEVFRRGDGLAVQLTCVHETQEDSEPAVYTLLSSAELSVLSLPSDVSYKLYGADGSIRATLTEGAVIPLTEQDGGIGAEHAYVLRFLWLT